MNGDMSNNGTSPKVTTPNATAGSSISLWHIIAFCICVLIIVALFITLIVVLNKRPKDKKTWEGEINQLENEKDTLANETNTSANEKNILANERNNLKNEKIALGTRISIAKTLIRSTERCIEEMKPSYYNHGGYWVNEVDREIQLHENEIQTLTTQIQDLEDSNQSLQKHNSLLTQYNSEWQTYASQHDEESQTYYKQWGNCADGLLKELETVGSENVILRDKNQTLQTENLKFSKNP